MKARVTVALGVVLACLLPVSTYAQASPASSSGALGAVVTEVRLLRQALERQAATAARSQLIIARLTLCDQRTARARAAVDRLEGDVGNAEREREQLQAAAREMERSLEQVTDPDRRQQLESDSRMLRARTIEVETQRARSSTRLAQAKQALDLEVGRYDELERWLNDLDRQLQAGQ